SDDIHPSTVQAEVPKDKPTEEPVVVFPKAKPNLPYPSRLQKEKNREKDDILAAKFMEIFRDLHFELSFADALIHMPKFAHMFKKLLNNKDKLIELTKTPLNENCSAVFMKMNTASSSGSKTLPRNTITNPKEDLKGITNRSGIAYQGPTIPTTSSSLVVESLADLDASINLMPLSVWNKLSLPDLSPTDSDFLLEEVDAFLALDDDATSPEVDQSYFDSEGDILLLESFLNNDPSLPPPNQRNYLPQVPKELKIYEAKTDKSSR
nr:hypothetical protein [Tanacetum cinerariifolium]